MRDERPLQQRASAGARPAPLPSLEPDTIRIDINRFKSEALTIVCHGDDIERWHWQKVLASLGR
jgi:hypothetical protein